ncbi:MAG TPA: HAD family hydrolase [Solirubrobacteraceae bacterium]|nr:HAD family hydrolase [Solirubrobacteraceae bacterium]
MSDPIARIRSRPVTTVLDSLRVEIAEDAFDAVLVSLEAVAADLGYGDIRALPGSVAWIEWLREHGKRVGLFATGDRATAALELAGIAGLFDEITVGARTAPALLSAMEELGCPPSRTITVTATAAGVVAARESGTSIVVAVARGFSSPEDLRQAGASTVVADLQELLRAVT